MELVDLMEPGSEGDDLMRSARSNYIASFLLSIHGGALIGFPLGSVIWGDDPEWGLAAAGAGLIVLSIPFARKSNRRAQKAIDMYNSNLSHAYPRRRPTFALISRSTGVGLGITF